MAYMVSAIVNFS